MSNTYEDIKSAAQNRTELNARLKRILSEGLELPIPGDHIEDDQPLFGRGLELDSLDTLEIVSLVEEEFGVYITDEDKTVFGSVNKIADFIVAKSEGQ